MKIWFLADTHFGKASDNEIWLNDYYSYFNDVLLPYMRKNVKNDDILVHLGDVFDNRSAIGIHTIYCVINVFEQLSKIFNDIRICVGNHDIWQKHSTEITALHAIKYIPNVKIYFKPVVEQIGSKSVLFAPWIEDINEQKELLKKNNSDYVFGHLEIGGCVTNSKGITMKSNNSIQSNDFKKAQVYAGHIHIRQDYKNIHYVGTPYHKDRGDIGNDKGITILDIETGDVKFVENVYSPRYVTYSIYDLLDTTVGELKELWKNNYVELNIKGSDYASCNFEALRNSLDNCYKEFNPKSDNSEGMINVNEELVISEAKSSGDMLDDYVDACDIDDSMKNEVKKYFKELKNRL